MATTDTVLVVSDAGPLIHLDELGCLDLFGGFASVALPRLVWQEVVKHRVRLTVDEVPNVRIAETESEPSIELRSLCDALGLEAGERSALALLESASARLFLCDDSAARLAAESMGFTVRGTIGLVVRSIRTRARTRQEVLEILRSLPGKSSLHLSRQLLQAVIVKVEKGAPDL